jgi:hypothetical protein
MTRPELYWVVGVIAALVVLLAFLSLGGREVQARADEIGGGLLLLVFLLWLFHTKPRRRR